MSRWIDADAVKNIIRSGVSTDTEADQEYVCERIDEAPSIDIVWCGECRRVREDGGHANCNGYLYCRKWKTLVDEDTYCSWGEREGE